MKILMVCLGNICRSPLAHGIMQHLADSKGLNWEIDSAGTGAYHIGKKPDYRSIEVSKKYGIDISNQKARQFTPADFQLYDYIFVMDKQNYERVSLMAKNQIEKEKVRMLIPNDVVPDPYYDDELFEPVYKMINKQCAKLLTQLQNENK